MLLGFTPTMAAIFLARLAVDDELQDLAFARTERVERSRLGIFFIAPVAEQCVSRNAYERPISEGAPPAAI